MLILLSNVAECFAHMDVNASATGLYLFFSLTSLIFYLVMLKMEQLILLAIAFVVL